MQDDMRGLVDLHVHTNASDGSESIYTVIEKAKKASLKYNLLWLLIYCETKIPKLSVYNSKNFLPWVCRPTASLLVTTCVQCAALWPCFILWVS